jgi:hypothetical protein
MSVLCPSCREETARIARAAVDLLADPTTTSGDRSIAIEEATRALEVLQLPPGEVLGGGSK